MPVNLFLPVSNSFWLVGERVKVRLKKKELSMKYFNKIAILLVLAVILLPGTVFSTGEEEEKSKKSLSVQPVDPGKAILKQRPVKPYFPNAGSRGSLAYGNDLWATSLFSFDIDVPTDFTTISPANYLALCGDFAPGDTQQMWIIDANDDSLKVVDITTGVESFIVDLPCPMDTGVWTSLSIHKSTGQFYAIATDEAQSFLYGFDPATGIIQELLNLELVAAISSSFDASGMLYVLDIETDFIYVVDVTAGTITELGAAGFDSNYAQGMGYDPVGDEVYLAAFEDFVGPQLRKLDRGSGEATFIANLPGETGAFGFPIDIGDPLAYAGPDDTICEGIPYYLANASAENYGSLEWTTSGDGSFDDPSRLDALYSAGPQDLLSGGAELCLTAFSGDGKADAMDCMTLVMQEKPTAHAGNNFTIVAKDEFEISSAWVTSYSAVMWTTSGDGAFNDPTLVNPSYIPGTADEENGEVDLCLTASPIEPCTEPETSCMTLTIIQLPEGIDFGDAPELGGIFFSYPTTLANGGAAHNIDPDVFLGDKIDGEPDGQPTVGADGDDNDVLYPSFGDDEDGVLLPASVFAGTAVSIDVKASVDGFLDAWMDFDLDNTWFNPNEHIFIAQPLVAGNNNLTFIVPAIAVPGQSYLRFRFRNDAIPLSFNGFANNGEVEDYTVEIKENTIEGWDFGDAPQGGDLHSYPTLLSDDGARHFFVPGIYLGTLIDIEPDGQPTPLADGDDTDKFYPSLGDDEDGVTLPAAASAGSVTTIQVQASVSGYLDAWMDFDLDGNWGGASEHIFTAQPLNAGINTLSFTVPSTADAGQSFIRFRFRNNAAPLTFKGTADNGEVEDYSMQIVQTPADGWDFGDAPDGMGTNLYPTLLNSNGARHAIVSSIFLGNFVDAEPDGQPDLPATGDDFDLVYPSAGDDEDGVSFTSQIKSGSACNIDVVASTDGYLDAWMDFDADGEWTVASEHIFTIEPLSAGTNSLSFNIPTSAAPGSSYIRFRFRDYDEPLNYKGAAENGEVEDYLVEITDGSQPSMDFGDAPESNQPFFLSYPTTIARNGAAHIINPDIFLGNLIDAEPDGQPNTTASGDDIDLLYPSLGDDEDGVNLPDSVFPGSTVTIEVIASVDGYLDAWMDFNLDNSWFAPIEHIFIMQPVVSGLNTLTFNVPAVAVAGKSYLRFRFRDYTGPLSFDGLADNGEVEDYAVQIGQGEALGWDYGDAPDGPYPTLLASDGARHVNDGLTWMGNLIDIELDGLQSIDGSGDDLNYVDDEDGVSFVNTLFIGGVATIQIAASVDGYLNAWMDFNQNGNWGDANDQIFTDQSLSAGVNTLSFLLPSSASTGSTFVRFRFGSQQGLTFSGLAQDGEVEDYQVTVYPAWSFIPTSVSHIISVPTGLPPLTNGDMLAVFFINNSGHEQCAGTMLYNAGQANQMFAYGDNEFTPDIKEGFATGEMISWKLFSAASGLMSNINVEYDQNYADHDGTFVPFGFSALTAIHYQENPCELPAGWEFAVTGQVHSVNIPLAANPNIFGDALAMGDWIGVFYLDDNGDEACGGVVQWNGVSNVAVNAYGDDPFTPEKDGFATGELLRWKLYDCDGMEVYSAKAIYNPEMPCEGSFGDLCLSELFSLQAAYFQNYSFTTGWNSISTYLIPSDPDVENMFVTNVDQLIILKNLVSLYWPYAGVNTIGNWDNETGYAIKVYEGFDMDITGTEFTDTELTLPEGWHYLPVLSPCDVSANELLGPLMDKITIATDLIGTKVWWPDANVFTLEFLEPGKAYKIRLTEEVIFNFPACDGKTKSGNMRNTNNISVPWGEIKMTPSGHMVSIMADAITEIEEGDYVGAFDQAGSLCGVVEVEDTNQNHVMILFGDDPTTEIKDGFAEDESIEFRWMKIATGEEFDLDVTFDFAMPNAERVFNNQGLSSVVATGITGFQIHSEPGDGIKIYPNPSNGIFNIEGLEESSSLKIFNAFGEEVKLFDLLTTGIINLTGQPTGVYFIRIEDKGEARFRKLILN